MSLNGQIPFVVVALVASTFTTIKLHKERLRLRILIALRPYSLAYTTKVLIVQFHTLLTKQTFYDSVSQTLFK
jgi:hypothetical protein